MLKRSDKKVEFLSYVNIFFRNSNNKPVESSDKTILSKIINAWNASEVAHVDVWNAGVFEWLYLKIWKINISKRKKIPHMSSQSPRCWESWEDQAGWVWRAWHHGSCSLWLRLVWQQCASSSHWRSPWVNMTWYFLYNQLRLEILRLERIHVFVLHFLVVRISGVGMVHLGFRLLLNLKVKL